MIAILFARQDSHYKTIPGLDVYDIDRDARTWTGGCPVVAHPPCRAWGRLRAFARPRCDEKDLARWAISQVRLWGGVLEHPAGSGLWVDQHLPRPGELWDEFGGFSIEVQQWWWGHRAEKKTWLYICGTKNLPEIPQPVGGPTHVIANASRKRLGDPGYRPWCTKREREATPPAFAAWLVETARRCRR